MLYSSVCHWSVEAPNSLSPQLRQRPSHPSAVLPQVVIIEGRFFRSDRAVRQRCARKYARVIGVLPLERNRLRIEAGCDPPSCRGRSSSQVIRIVRELVPDLFAYVITTPQPFTWVIWVDRQKVGQSHIDRGRRPADKPAEPNELPVSHWQVLSPLVQLQRQHELASRPPPSLRHSSTSPSRRCGPPARPPHPSREKTRPCWGAVFRPRTRTEERGPVDRLPVQARHACPLDCPGVQSGAVRRNEPESKRASALSRTVFRSDEAAGWCDHAG